MELFLNIEIVNQIS